MVFCWLQMCVCVCACFCFQIYDIAKVAIIDKPIWQKISFKIIMKIKFLNNLINFWLPIEIWEKNLIDFWKFFFKKSLKFWHKNSIFFNSLKHLPIVVNAVGTRVLVQLFSLESGLCPIFFHLGISRHVLGIFRGARGHVKVIGLEVIGFSDSCQFWVFQKTFKETLVSWKNQRFFAGPSTSKKQFWVGAGWEFFKESKKHQS